MQKLYAPIRFVVLFLLVISILTVFVSALYSIQRETERRGDDDVPRHRIVTRRQAITAARGNIYDRNGILLASGRPSYNISLDWWMLRGRAETNDIILELIYATLDAGLDYVDTFPVTSGAPFEFIGNMTNSQRSRLNAYLDFFGHDRDISVSDLLSWMRNHYNIDMTVGILDARLIIGVRYELEVRAIIGTIPPYVFAHDVGTNFVAYINERNLNGVFTVSTYVREYHTPHAPHTIGYIGPMTAEEFEHFRHLGYPMDATVGKVGAELAFEEILHGRDGLQITRLTDEGTVLSHEIVREPEPGGHVFLTIDIDLQRATEQALMTEIERINFERLRFNATVEDEEYELDFIPGGAVVVVDVNTGEVLSAASYPGFSLHTLAEDWAFLNTDPAFPMLNRVTHGRYAPGSTFKMVTALAGLRHGVIGRYLPVYCGGVYDRWEDQLFVAHCWIFTQQRVGHNYVDVVQALECSCNYFFLWVADRFPEGQMDGAYRIADAAMDFGLGIPTGIELPENVGRLATATVKREQLNEGWLVADTLLAGFGQGLNRFTPLQLASYTKTIANGGTLFSLSILSREYTHDFVLVGEHSPEIISQIEETQYIEYIQEGMVAASRGRRGTARRIFGNYPIVVASKTGTVQIEGRALNDGMFVAYAPAHDPQIAVAIVVEKGGSGSEIAPIARMIFDHYFITESTFFVMPYGAMIP